MIIATAVYCIAATTFGLPCYLVVLTLKSYMSQQEGCLVIKTTVNEPLP